MASLNEEERSTVDEALTGLKDVVSWHSGAQGRKVTRIYNALTSVLAPEPAAPAPPAPPASPPAPPTSPTPPQGQIASN